MDLRYSFVIPVYNRPQEVQELLESFTQLETELSYEIVLVEDGSTETSESVVNTFGDQLQISYYSKENSGPGDSRNFGMQRAQGNYFIILDSDCLLPPEYLTTVDQFLTTTFFHCFGGADAAHDSFTPLQKAINYVMTSFLTTGGIRGSAHAVQTFEPRSFNMGISKEAFDKTGGFSRIHPGEDPDLSQRIRKAGYTTTFLPGAHVYHKRRISWKKFYQQVTKFGTVRPILNRWHPEAAKLTFWLPSLFVLFVLASLLGALLWRWEMILPLALYVCTIFLHATFKTRSVSIGTLSLAALFVQFFGYGLAFMKSSFFIGWLKKDPEQQYPKLFFN